MSLPLRGMPARLAHRFGDTPIHKKYMIAACALLLALLLGGAYILSRSYSLSYQEHVKNARSDFETAYTALDKFEQRMLHLASMVQSNTLTVRMLSQTPEYSTNEYLRAKQDLLPMLYMMLDGSNDYFCRIYVDSSLDMIDRTSRILLLSDIKDQPWAQQALSGWGWWRFYSAQVLEADEPALLAPIRNLDKTDELVALFRVDVRPEALAQMLRAPQANAYVSCYLQTAEGDVVASSGLPLEDYTLDAPASTLEGFDATSLNILSRDGNTVLYQALPTSLWRMTMVVHHAALYDILFPQFFLFALIGFLLTLTGIACALPILIQLINRIRRFSAHVQRYNALSAAHPQLTPPRLEPLSHDEIGQLVQAHNAMLDRIDALMREREAHERELRRLEITALQAQIKPHFLYNTLEAIAWMARMNQPANVERTVRSLTRFYRLCLSKGCDVLPLVKELDIVRHYFEIQCARFEQSFTLTIDVDDALLGILLPKITLQPLVENALVHGILESGQSSGEIRVFTRRPADGPTLLCIADSGAHFSPEAFVQALLKGSSDAAQGEGEGYGLQNVERRLCLFFQKPQVLYLDRSDPAFTCLVLPLFARP